MTPLFTIPASNYDITFSPFPSPWPAEQGSQAPAAVPKIMLCNKAGCVDVFIGWKTVAVSYSNTSTYTQVRKLWSIYRGQRETRLLEKSDLFEPKWELVDKWLNVNGWLGSCTRHASSEYCFHNYKWALLEVIHMSIRVTWKQSFLIIADDVLNKVWLVLFKYAKRCSSEKPH